MNRDQYLLKKGWRLSPVLQPVPLVAQEMQGDPAPPTEKSAGSPQAVLAVAPAPAARDSSPLLRQQPVPPGKQD